MNVPLGPVVDRLAAEIAELKVRLAMADALIAQLLDQLPQVPDDLTEKTGDGDEDQN